MTKLPTFGAGTGLRVVVADDHPVVRAGLREILERNPGIKVVGEATNGVALVQQVIELRPDVAVVDISMPHMNGLDATVAIREQCRETRVLLLSVQCTQGTVLDALEAGALGYMLKDAVEEELSLAVGAVARNQSYFSPEVATLVASRASGHPRGSARLSARERMVVQLISEGLPTREIAAQAFISMQTVKSHRANAMRKLGLRTTADLIRYALEHGLTPQSRRRPLSRRSD